MDVQACSLYVQFPDDVLEAVCLAVGARLGMEHGFKVIPENVAVNDDGIPMKMSYYSK